MKNLSEISEYVQRQTYPVLLARPWQLDCHIALLAFPHVSETLCGIKLSELERVPKEMFIGPPPICSGCSLKMALLVAKLQSE